MSQGRPRPAQRKKAQPPMSERLAGGDPWDRETKGGKRIVRVEEAPLMKPGGGTVKDPRYAMGMNTHRPTPPEYLIRGDEEDELLDDRTANPPEPACVYKDDQTWISKEARDKRASSEAKEGVQEINHERQQLRGKLATYERLARERGLDIRSDVRVVERRLEALDRKLGLSDEQVA